MKNVEESLSLLRRKGIIEFDIIQGLGFPNVKEVQHSLRVDPRTFYRFMVPLSEFSNYEYVFVADVDTYFLQESPTMLDYHLSRSRVLGLPISNCVRLNADGNHSKRLTGFHFFKVNQYKEKLSEQINDLFNSAQNLSEFLNGLDWDEEALFKLVSIGFPIEPFKSKVCIRPWHGLHLGAASKHKIDRKNKERYYNAKGVTQLDMTNSLKLELNDPVLIDLLRLVPLRSFYNFLRFFKIPVKHLFMLKYIWSLRLKSMVKGVFEK
ncbi:hypothetical protein ACV07N_04845 [Roseivirga echinicomitans]